MIIIELLPVGVGVNRVILDCYGARKTGQPFLVTRQVNVNTGSLSQIKQITVDMQIFKVFSFL